MIKINHSSGRVVHSVYTSGGYQRLHLTDRKDMAPRGYSLLRAPRGHRAVTIHHM